jgi:hypothetical protein
LKIIVAIIDPAVLLAFHGVVRPDRAFTLVRDFAEDVGGSRISPPLTKGGRGDLQFELRG